MKATKKQATVRLFKKLSALRATLSNEERDILDNLVVTEDVTAHQMKAGAVSKALSAKAAKGAVAGAHQMKAGAVSKALSAKAAKGAVAGAHQMKAGAVSKALSAKAAKGAVAGAHQMKAGAVSKALSAKAAKGAVAGAHQMKSNEKVALRIAFDPDTEEYKIQE
jgi:hypothetical protein